MQNLQVREESAMSASVSLSAFPQQSWAQQASPPAPASAHPLTPWPRWVCSGALAAGRWQTPPAPRRRCCWRRWPPPPRAAGWRPPRCRPGRSQRPPPARRAGQEGHLGTCPPATAWRAAAIASGAGRAVVAGPWERHPPAPSRLVRIGGGGAGEVGGRVVHHPRLPGLRAQPRQLLNHLPGRGVRRLEQTDAGPAPCWFE